MEKPRNEIRCEWGREIFLLLSEHSLGLELTQSSFPDWTLHCLHGFRKGVLTAGGWWRICHYWGSSCSWTWHHSHFPALSHIPNIATSQLPAEGQGGQMWECTPHPSGCFHIRKRGLSFTPDFHGEAPELSVPSLIPIGPMPAQGHLLGFGNVSQEL